MKKLFLISCLFFMALVVTAQEINTAKLDSLFVVVDENEKLMGGLSIFKAGEEVYSRSLGFADVENEVIANNKTRYRIGSISKTFTAAIIMELVEEGKLNLDATLEKFYPEMPNASEIKIEDLMSHQSGLFNFTNDSEYLVYLEEEKTKEELLAIFKEKGTVFKPKERTEYSNTNYVLLTFIAEDVSGMTLTQLLKNNITQPLGLSDTYYGGKIGALENEAKSYKKTGTWKPNTETDLSIPQGAGAIVSTPYDLNKFFTALFAGEVVTEESLEIMKGNETGNGMGLFKLPFQERMFYGHSGGIDGFSSLAVYYPEEQLSFAFIANGTDMGVNEFVNGVLSIVFDVDYDLPAFAPVIEVPAEKLEAYTGLYSTPAIPIKINIFLEDGVLLAQGTGQPSFAPEATAVNIFKFDPARLSMEFLPEEDKMIMVQAGTTYEFTRE